jgi:hypothetical protein
MALEHLRSEIVKAGGTHKPDQEIIGHIIKKAPNIHQSVTGIMTTMDATEEDTLSKVKKQYVNFLKRHVTPKYGKKGNEDLTIMSHSKYPPKAKPKPSQPMRKGGKLSKKLKGNCNYCGKQGHKAADCFKRKSTSGINGKKDTRKCLKCNRRGHIARDCPRREERAESLFVGTVVTIISNPPNSLTIRSLTHGGLTMRQFSTKSCSLQKDTGLSKALTSHLKSVTLQPQLV